MVFHGMWCNGVMIGKRKATLRANFEPSSIGDPDFLLGDRRRSSSIKDIQSFDASRALFCQVNARWRKNVMNTTSASGAPDRRKSLLRKLPLRDTHRGRTLRKIIAGSM